MKTTQKTFYSLKNGALTSLHGDVVREFPLQLIVNGREIATLISSPHELRFLVAGFLRLQGFVKQLEDFEMLSVCEDLGAANVRIKGELPERLKPVLTSGCGTGVCFELPFVQASSVKTSLSFLPVKPADIFSLMEALAQQAKSYRAHGGIHSSAIGRGGKLLLHAEDLGRHNTLDRIAGEALFKSIDLTGTTLVTSGRISTEMVAKAALLGVRLIASRTSPTDMAVRLCDQCGICLTGYVRGDKFTVYSHPEMIEQYPDLNKIDGVTGVILAGGSSSRMGCNKALLELNGKPFIEAVYQILASMFREVIIVTSNPDEYSSIPCRKVADIFPGVGSIAGLHAGLFNSATERIFVVACDMPSLNTELIRRLCAEAGDWDAVVPANSKGYLEPLHALYSRSCIDQVQDFLEHGDKSILLLLDKIRVRKVEWEEIKDVSGASASFSNVNTPREYGELTQKYSCLQGSCVCEDR